MIQKYKIVKTTTTKKPFQIESGVDTQNLSFNDNNLILADSPFGSISSGIEKYS